MLGRKIAKKKAGRKITDEESHLNTLFTLPGGACAGTVHKTPRTNQGRPDSIKNVMHCCIRFIFKAAFVVIHYW